MWAPALYTFLAITWSSLGWLVIAGIIVLATVALHPATALARRFLEQHVPPDVLADARAGAPSAEESLEVGPPSLIDPDTPVMGRPQA